MPLRARDLRLACGAAVAAVGALASSVMAAPAQPLTPESVVADFCGAWNAPDRDSRDRLLARVWAPGGVYSDPEPTLAAGRAALSDAIADFHRHYPGARFRCSAPQAHHGFLRVSWIQFRPDGTQVTHGMDFYERAPDGRIRRLTGFFGPPPEVEPRP